MRRLEFSIAGVSAVGEVKVWVGWHVYVPTEFKREIKIVNSFPEKASNLWTEAPLMNTVVAVEDTTNISVTSNRHRVHSAQSPKPRLHVDAAKITLKGTNKEN